MHRERGAEALAGVGRTIRIPWKFCEMTASYISNKCAQYSKLYLSLPWHLKSLKHQVQEIEKEESKSFRSLQITMSVIS